jgi:hypothetical protein
MIWPCGQKFRPKARCPPSHERSETRDSRQAEFDLQAVADDGGETYVNDPQWA